MKNSCFVPYLKCIFKGNSILELLKNIKHFENLLDSMRIMGNNFTPIFLIQDGESDKSLGQIFAELEKDCNIYLQTIKKSSSKNDKENKDELNLVKNFVNFYKKIDKRIKQLELSQNTTEKTEISLNKNLSFREKYKLALQDEVFKPNDKIKSNNFNKLMNDAQEKINTKFVTNKSIKQITKELVSHSKSLPLEPESSIFYRYNSTNLKYHEFIIAGPEGTPYDSGCFLFRMYCPATYPDKNPKVNIYTTGNGSFRFGPNLYCDGKVCLSILGTWLAQAGESWIPGTSTMMQIMISIQSIVMNADPYFNEPGYERSYGTESGMKSSREYNHPIRLHNMKLAMLDMIRNPTQGFENAILTHFRLKTNYIKETCAKWVSEAPQKSSKEFKEIYNSLCCELDKLATEKNKPNNFDKLNSKSTNTRPIKTRKTIVNI